MKRYVQTLPNCRVTVITVPGMNFNSLQVENLRVLRRFLAYAARRVIGSTVIVDTTPVISAGAGFLTEVHRLAARLAERGIQMVIAGNLASLFRLVGWERRYPIYDSLVAAVMRLAVGEPPPALRDVAELQPPSRAGGGAADSNTPLSNWELSLPTVAS